MDPQFMANIEQMADWAKGIAASRNPDLVVGDNYMLRWWAIPRNPFRNVYIHLFLGDDDDRALHDHPWASTSVILTGGYKEHLPDGVHNRKPGDIVSRSAEQAHRVELLRTECGAIIPALTLFFTREVERDWGFHCPKGWVRHDFFTDPKNPGQRGRGCD